MHFKQDGCGDIIETADKITGDDLLKKIREMISWNSLEGKMLIAFIITAVVPSFVLILFSYFNTAQIVRENVADMLQANLQQTESSMNVWMDSYEDILFQVYMNDDIVDMVGKIEEGEEIEFVSGQLRKTLRGMFYPKEHLKCITVITKSGHVVFYDLLTGSSTRTSWMGSVGMSQAELYEYFSQDNTTRLLPTDKAGVFASDTYYLFHIGHRIIDYQNVDEELGVVIVSIDEEILREICAEDESADTFKFMVNTEGNMVSCSEKELLATHVIDWTDKIEERERRYEAFLKERGFLKDKNAVVKAIHEEEFGGDIVCVSSQQELISQLNVQQRIMLLVMGVTAAVLLALIVVMIKNLMNSINRLVRTMKEAEKGSLSVRSRIDPSTPTEIQIVEAQFNHMMDELEVSVQKEKDAIDSQRRAEIAALEAQINPHFLYNTLDTINWIAIDNDEYEISNAITSLAAILRYGIDNSNADVRVSREAEWLKQYLFLQQIRLKNTFQCEIHVSQEVMDWKIHKLLFQPFVENSLYHGFQVEKDVYILRVEIEPGDDLLMIRIWDNGIGIAEETVDMINSGIYPESGGKNSIGMKNAIGRIKMYYGELADVKISSAQGEYTEVMIQIPKITD